MASVKFIPCKCGCGCSHHCERLYGPYFNRSVRRQGRVTSEYLGGLREAAEAISGARSGGAYEKALHALMEAALKRARAWSRRAIGSQIRGSGKITSDMARPGPSEERPNIGVIGS